MFPECLIHNDGNQTLADAFDDSLGQSTEMVFLHGLLLGDASDALLNSLLSYSFAGWSL